MVLLINSSDLVLGWRDREITSILRPPLVGRHTHVDVVPTSARVLADQELIVGTPAAVALMLGHLFPLVVVLFADLCGEVVPVSKPASRAARMYLSAVEMLIWRA